MAVTTIENLRNIAIIAHVDHGKTTIVDSMLKQAGVYRENEAVVEQVMDSNDLERERGITILAKNTAIDYKGIRINVVDTPGHADFGGEVERVLKMVDSVLLVVDAFDGPMPQTRFVLHKALGLGLKPIVCINKIDRPDARPLEVVDMVLDLFIELGADDEQLEFPVVYTSGKTCVATLDLKEYEEGKELDFTPLLDTVVKYTPCPVGDPEGPMQLLVSNIDSDPYIGRIGVGRVERGTIKQGENVALVTYGEDGKRNARVVKLLRFHNLGREEVASASIGEIVCVAGIAECFQVLGSIKLMVDGCSVFLFAYLQCDGHHGLREVQLVLLAEPYRFVVPHEATDNGSLHFVVDVGQDSLLHHVEGQLRHLFFRQIHFKPLIEVFTQLLQAVADGDTAAVLAYWCEGGLCSVYFVHNCFVFKCLSKIFLSLSFLRSPSKYPIRMMRSFISSWLRRL